MSGQLKEVRERIKSVKSTQQITKAMKMVSAAKLRKAQQAIVQMRPYANKQNSMLANILSSLDGDASTAFGQHRPVENVLVVIVTSNRGLCGAFNTNVIKSALANIEAKYSHLLESGKLTFLCIGKRGHDFVRRRYADSPIIEDYVTLFDNLTFDNVASVARELMDRFEDKTFDAIDVSYGRFKNAAMQYPETESFLPVAKMEKQEGDNSRADYIFEPDKTSLLEHLVPSILQTSFYKYLLDTHASEHGARMTAMDKASENAEEMLRDLKITYNKARQEAITKELSEIVGGAAALES
ncbi:MAG: ATP synthase F1 subunit gamma [Bacteroidota bacterium]